MSLNVYNAIRASIGNAEIVDANGLLYELRLYKSEAEIGCLKEAARIADIGYLALMDEAACGKTELQLEAAACSAAKRAGAEFIPFCLVSSGPRIETIIGRSTEKIIKNNEMVMAALAVQYQGYVATVNFPFVVGDMDRKQRELINMLVEGEDMALKHLKAGIRQSLLVKTVKDFFREREVSRYDLYPPLHGIGAAEAESPYPSENSTGIFESGMTVNIDLSLFGHPGGSNRIEEGFVVTKDGYKPMSMLVRELSKKWKEKNR
jgi:Xaa-Pro aminopeptidase